MKKWDVFISHASEDKDEIARPLAEALRQKGIRVWYDDFTLTLGDGLRRSIDRGLAESRYGIVILSRSFFAKEWPQRELDGLAAREVGGEKVILPVWHGLDHKEAVQYSPLLADRLAVSTSAGLDAVVREIMLVLRPDSPAAPPQVDAKKGKPSTAPRGGKKKKAPLQKRVKDNLNLLFGILVGIATIVGTVLTAIPILRDLDLGASSPTATLAASPTTGVAAADTPSPTVTPQPLPTTPAPTDTPTSPPSPTGTFDPVSVTRRCEGAGSEPCLYLPRSGDSWQTIAANTAFADECRWPEIANVNRDYNGTYRMLEGALIDIGVFIPVPDEAYYARPRIVNNAIPAAYIPYCEETDRLPCVYVVQQSDGLTAYNYAPLASMYYGSTELALVNWLKEANLADGCNIPHEAIWLEPGTRVVIPMMPEVATPEP